MYIYCYTPATFANAIAHIMSPRGIRQVLVLNNRKMYNELICRINIITYNKILVFFFYPLV